MTKPSITGGAFIDSDLFERALARRSDPQTSHDAADTVTPSLTHLEQMVYAALKNAWFHGLTIDELVTVTHLEKVTVSPRLRPLCEKGLVREAHFTRAGKSGRQQTVWLARQ
jgi:hypothetical protein